MEHLKYDEILGDPDWDKVNKLTELDASSVLPNIKEIKRVCYFRYIFYGTPATNFAPCASTFASSFCFCKPVLCSCKVFYPFQKILSACK